MSMITRCPACATAFRVVPDQLRISDGWVRCGHCAEVFDAALALNDGGTPPAGMPPEPQPASLAPAPEAGGAEPSEPAVALPTEPPWPGEPEPEPTEESQAHDTAAEDDVRPWVEPNAPELPASDPVGSMDLGGAPMLPLPVEPEPVVVPGDGPGPAEGPSEPEPEPDMEPEPEMEPDTEVLTEPDIATAPQAAPAEPAPTSVLDDTAIAMPLRRAAEPSHTPSSPGPARAAAPAPARPPVEPELQALSFIRQAPRPEPGWRRALRRALWVLAGVTLAGALLLQVALYERDRIAAAMPAFKPWLQALCVPVGCSVQALRNIEAIVIEDASFSALREDGYRLQLTLRNRSELAQALPAIELSLTDIAEQPVLRRVLLPTDLGAASAELPAHGEWHATLDLSVADNAGRARIVGYRLLPFYP